VKRAVEEFGDKHCQTITPKMISLFISRFASQGYAKKTVTTQLLVINLIMTHAVVEGDVEYNPAASVSIPKGLTRHRRELPSEADIETAKRSVKCPFGLFAYFILYTGCRRGEALALTYGDIDFTSRMIVINKSVYNESNTPKLKEPKTEAGTRRVILLDVLASALPKNRRADELVFPNEYGTLMSETQFQRQWELYTNATGITSTPHQFRHAYATILFEAGIEDKDAQELLGHANISTTKDIYTHITKKRMQATADKLNAAASV
jgi:integrase